MPKRNYWLVADTETTEADTVADFGAVIVDRKGNIYAECGVLVEGHYGKHELFYDSSSEPDAIWGRVGLERRKAGYARMLSNGKRMLASVDAINRWLVKAVAHYQPELTAYNLAFDLDKCERTGIDLSVFDKRFCLWQAAAGNFAHTKRYRDFILSGHYFNPPTALGNMTYKTNAEVMCGFLSGNGYREEPHTALEDARDFEVPILVEVLKRPKWREKAKPYNWKAYQMRDWFRPATPSDRGSLI